MMLWNWKGGMSVRRHECGLDLRAPNRSALVSHMAVWIVAVVILFGPLQRVHAQGSDDIKAHYTKHEYQIPMRDGVRLFTTVFSPKDTTQSYPLLLVRTQSGARPYGADEYPNTLIGPSPLPHFVKEG